MDKNQIVRSQKGMIELYNDYDNKTGEFKKEE